MSLLVDIKKDLGGFHLSASFESSGGTLALLGASGCGKSLTLKCIAGIVKPDFGKIILDGVTLFDSEKKINLPPQKRRVGYLFQQYALFPNMTVEENIRAGVRDKKQARERAAEMMKRMRLHGLEKHKPHQLSGGQQQRTALARILVNQPEVLLLDEPFSALDSYLRAQMEEEVRALVKDFGKPVVMVSHSRDEVYRLSDNVAIMAAGRVEHIGPKKEVFARPQTVNGAILTGFRNISRVEQKDGKPFAADWGLPLDAGFCGASFAGIRAQDVRAGEGFPCEVVEMIENPFSLTVMVRPEGSSANRPILLETEKEGWCVPVGGRVLITLPPEAVQPLKEG